MTSRQLDYFSTIAECQNFSAAARKLYVSQPAISQQIQVLEEEIGYPLIHRTRHHVELTEYGQIFLQFCQKLKDDYTDLCDSMYELKKSKENQFTIGLLEGLSIPWFSRLLQYFSAENPDCIVSIQSHSFSGLTRELQQNRLDLTLSLLLDSTEPEILVKKLCESPCMFVISRNHPLSQKNEICIRDFDNNIFYQITQDELPSAPRIMADVCQHYGISPKQIIPVPNPSSMLLMLTSGVGVTLLDKYTYPEILKFNSLKTIDTDYSHNLNLMWNAKTANPYTEKFVSYAQTYIHKYIENTV